MSLGEWVFGFFTRLMGVQIFRSSQYLVPNHFVNTSRMSFELVASDGGSGGNREFPGAPRCR